MTSPYRRVQGYAYLIVAIFLVCFAATAATLIWQERRIDDKQLRTTDFHQPSLLHASIIKEELLRLETLASARQDPQTTDAGLAAASSRQEIETGLYAIQSEVDALTALQDRFGGMEFDPPMLRLRNELAALRQIVSDAATQTGSVEPARRLKLQQSLFFYAEQLRRLHLIALSQIDEEIRADLARRNFIIGPLAVVILVGGIAAVVYLTAQTRATLRQLESTGLALREGEERIRAIVDQLPAAVVLKDSEGRYLTVNKRFEEFRGLEASALVGKSAKDLFTAEQAKRFSELDGQVLQTGEVFEEEAEVPYPDGTRRSFVFTRFPVLDLQGTPTAVGVIGTDITERKQLQTRLRQAEKMQAVGQLTGGIAHDFNNLMAVVMGNAELLGERVGERDPEVRAVIRAAARGRELTQHLLAFSRKQPLQARVVDPNAVVTGMRQILRRTLGATIEIETDLAADVWTCEVDPGQLENALLNLGLNARDAMPDGGRLAIETKNTRLDEVYAQRETEVTPGHYVLLAVSDNGMGIPPEQIEQVFEPFFTSKDVGSGSGLGLSMVYGFVKQSGGHVTIQSALGQGTTVNLYLPKSEKPAPAPEEPVRETPVPGSDLLVLVVEDDPDLRSLAVTMLGGLGYRTLAAPDGAAAISRLDAARRIDLLLTDVVLPGGMDGAAVAEAARIRHPAIKVVYMSGYTEDAILHQGKLDPGVLLLQKPFRKATLASMLQKALAPRALPDSVGTDDRSPPPRG